MFLAYTLLGQWMPDVIAHKGQSLTKVAQHQWLTTEGVFGIALGVSTDFVFLFVLFGALLEHAGAGNYFIRMAFAGLGHLRGGPGQGIGGGIGRNGCDLRIVDRQRRHHRRVHDSVDEASGLSRHQGGSGGSGVFHQRQLTPPVMGAGGVLDDRIRGHLLRRGDPARLACRR